MKARIALAIVLLVSVIALNFHRVARAQVANPGNVFVQLQALTAIVDTLQAQVAALQADDAAAKANVATLQSAVDKLDGNITAADLVGTYSVAGFQTELDPLVPASTPATINSSAYEEGFTLNADGTGTGHGIQQGWTLVQGTWSVNSFFGPGGAGGQSETLTWTYSGGLLAIVFQNGDRGQFVVGAGGRVIFNASTNTDHTTSFFIATRLQ